MFWTKKTARIVLFVSIAVLVCGCVQKPAWDGSGADPDSMVAQTKLAADKEAAQSMNKSADTRGGEGGQDRRITDYPNGPWNIALVQKSL